jgi:hypothetical protein
MIGRAQRHAEWKLRLAKKPPQPKVQKERKVKEGKPPFNKREHRLRSKYGLTLEDYDEMVARQGGRCLICQQVPEKLVVDHHHGTGRVRGLLCFRCNSALGFLLDSPNSALEAARYLQAED